MARLAQDSRALFQYPIRRLIVRSHKHSKPRNLYLILSDRAEIWQAPRQQCCRSSCLILMWYYDLICQLLGFETSRDFTIRHLKGYWNETQACTCSVSNVCSSASFGWHIKWSTGSNGFPAQGVGNAENVSMSWRHHGDLALNWL